MPIAILLLILRARAVPLLVFAGAFVLFTPALVSVLISVLVLVLGFVALMLLWVAVAHSIGMVHVCRVVFFGLVALNYKNVLFNMQPGYKRHNKL